MMTQNKVMFKVGDKEFAVRRPKPFEKQQGEVVYHRRWKECAADGGFILRQVLFKVLEKNGLWDKEKEDRLKAIDKELAGGERKLVGGGIKLSDARRVAFDMARARAEREKLLYDYVSHDEHTAEAQATNAQFDFLCAKCIIDNDRGDPVFKTLDDFVAKRDAGDEVAREGTKQLQLLLSPDLVDWRKKLPENKFLVRYKFADPNLRLINEAGQFVDEDGRLVNENGFYIKYVDGKEVRIDRDGNELTDEGDFKAEFTPFLDETGNPISEPEAV
jgi:hypothetical protein